MGSQGGSQRYQTPGDAYRHPATIVQVKWLIRRRQTTVCDDQNSPEKRKVGSSTLPLPTISQPGWQHASSALSLFKGRFRLYLAGMPEYAAECRRVRGELVGTAPDPDLWDFCGGSPGLRLAP
jgi:hypothetical protein